MSFEFGTIKYSSIHLFLMVDGLMKGECSPISESSLSLSESFACCLGVLLGVLFRAQLTSTGRV